MHVVLLMSAHLFVLRQAGFTKQEEPYDRQMPEQLEWA